jgi:hypothetical protein
MNKQEIRDLKKHNINVDNIVEPNGQIINSLIVISNGTKQLHDSGFPFIKIYGVIKDGLVDLGWHDHYVSYVSTNVDSYGKNIFHIMPWLDSRKKWKVRDNFVSIGTFQIGEYGKDNNDYVIVQ